MLQLEKGRTPGARGNPSRSHLRPRKRWDGKIFRPTYPGGTDFGWSLQLQARVEGSFKLKVTVTVTRTRLTRGPFQVGIDAAPRALLTELQVRTLSARDDAHGKPASADGDRPPQGIRVPSSLRQVGAKIAAPIECQS